MTEGLGVQGARETRRQTEGCRTGGAHLAGQRDSGTGGHGGGEVLQAPNPRPPSPWLMLFVQILLLGRIWTWRGAFWGVPPKKKTELWGFSAPSRRHQKGWEKGKVRKGQRGWWGGAASAHLLRGLRGPDERGSSPPWGRGGGGESVSWGQPADVFPVVPDVLVGSLGAPPQPLGCGCGRAPLLPPPTSPCCALVSTSRWRWWPQGTRVVGVVLVALCRIRPHCPPSPLWTSWGAAEPPHPSPSWC